MKPLFWFTLIVASLFAIPSLAQRQRTTEKKEEEVARLIFSLPEIRKANNYVKKQTQGKRHLAIHVDQQPTKQDNRYWITVFEDNGMNLVSHFKFFVDARTHAISYWDVANDKIIPLNQWRKHHKNY